MALPEVDIQPGEPLQAAERKVVATLRPVGLELEPFEGVNVLGPAGSGCRFLHGRLAGRGHIVCIMVEAWDDETVLAVLNILLNLRLDPDPPGESPLFTFYSAHEVPPVLLGLFGNTPGCELECRAALVANFGNELHPAQALQFAAVAVHLLRECLHLRTDFYRPGGEVELGRWLVEAFRPDQFPGAAPPLNSLIVLGFLFGEMLRARLPHATRWARVKDCAPWPALIVGSVAGADAAGVPQLVFSPLASVIKAYELKRSGYLDEVARALEARCEEVLAPGALPAPGGPPPA